MNQNQPKNNIQKNSVKEKNNTNNNKMNYYHCIQSNFSIKSNYKSLYLPFSIYRTSFDYLRNSPEKTDRRKGTRGSRGHAVVG